MIICQWCYAVNDEENEKCKRCNTEDFDPNEGE